MDVPADGLFGDFGLESERVQVVVVLNDVRHGVRPFSG